MLISFKCPYFCQLLHLLGFGIYFSTFCYHISNFYFKWTFLIVDGIGFTFLHFKIGVIPFVPETKMVDVGKLISSRTYWSEKSGDFVHTTTSASLILSHAFGANHMTRNVYIYSRLPRTHSLTFWLPEPAHTLSLSLFISTSRNTLTVPVCKTQLNTSKLGAYTFCDLFLSSSAFSAGLIPVSNTASEISSNPERDKNQHGRRHVLPRIHCYISVYWYLAWNT